MCTPPPICFCSLLTALVAAVGELASVGRLENRIIFLLRVIRRLFGSIALHVDLHMRGDFAVQPDRHVEFADSFQWFFQVDLAAVDLVALRLELMRNVLRSDRAEEVVVLAGLALEGEYNFVEARAE